MATGDLNDLLARIDSLLPSWYGNSETPVTDGVLAAFAEAGSIIYGQYAYTVLQTRIKTATDTFLDLIANDFFGVGLFPRGVNESDTSYRNRILLNLIRPRATRQAVIQALTDLTGRAPYLFEPARPADTGGWSVAGWGFGSGGGWGSLEMPYQAFCIAYRPISIGVPYVGGWGSSVGAWSTPSQLEWANISLVQVTVTDAQIYSAIDQVKTEATTIWTQIQS